MDPLLQNFPTFVTCLARSGRRKYLIVVVTHISADVDGSKSCIETPNKKNNPCEGGSLRQNKMRQTKLILDFELYLHNVLVLTERQVRPCRPGLFRRSSVSWNYLPDLLAAWHNLEQFGMQHPSRIMQQCNIHPIIITTLFFITIRHLTPPDPLSAQRAILP